MDRCNRAAMTMLLVCIGICIQSMTVIAQTAISEKDLLAAVADSHPAMLELEALAAEARGERAAARLWDNPEVWMERESYSDDLGESRIGVSFALPFDGRRSLRARAAQYGLAAAEAEVVLAGMRVREQARADFADWYVSGERYRSSRSARELADELAQMMDERAAAGEASRLAMQRLKLVAAELRAAESLAESEFLRASRMVQRWYPAASGTTTARAPELPPSPLAFDLKDRPDITASSQRLAQSEALRRLSGRWLKLPSVDVGWIDPSQGPGGSLIGLSIEVPLFDRNQGDEAYARSRLAATRAAYQSDTLRARLEWEAARDSYERLRETALGQMDVAARADSVIIAADAAFRVGEMGITDLLESLRSVQAGRDSALELYAAALSAHRTLELAAGKPLLSY